MKNIGDIIAVSVNGKVIEGTVRFATATFISIDGNDGITSIMKFDGNSNSWRIGKLPAVIVTHMPYDFSKRLAEVLVLARRVVPVEHDDDFIEIELEPDDCDAAFDQAGDR